MDVPFTEIAASIVAGASRRMLGHDRDDIVENIFSPSPEDSRRLLSPIHSSPPPIPRHQPFPKRISTKKRVSQSTNPTPQKKGKVQVKSVSQDDVEDGEQTMSWTPALSKLALETRYTNTLVVRSFQNAKNTASITLAWELCLDQFNQAARNVDLWDIVPFRISLRQFKVCCISHTTSNKRPNCLFS